MGLWLWHAHSVYRPKAEVFQSRIQPALFFQEGVPFNPKNLPPPSEFLELLSGNLPAMLVSSAMRPTAHALTPKQPWDPLWFLIHEVLSFLLWFAVGLLVDSGFLRIEKSIIAHLAVRFALAVFLLVRGVADIAWRIQVVAWLAFGAYLMVVGLRWVFSKIHFLLQRLLDGDPVSGRERR